ncbi:MAG: TorF family putative porin [Exilibacterium sp.]
MKKNMQLVAAIALTSSAIMTATTPASADVSANVGLVSEYYFRGVNLGDAGVYAGADFEAAGFYAGTWWIDDGTGGSDNGVAGGDGMETDFYLGYNFDINETFSIGLGYNRYEYTYGSNFEHELDLSASFGPVSIEYASGEADDGDSETTDYDFLAVSWSGEIFGAKIGTFENDDTDNAYDYLELSASGEVVGLDMTFSIGKTTNVESAGSDVSSGDGYMVLDISKSFDL